jgi:antitoxin (DNA-binding transcriptional repressor) of toxin-antitoxin stability system
MSLVSAQYPASCKAGDGALVYSVRELRQHTARIMSEIENSGKPAIITRHGRFIATIRPLAPGQVESRVLPEMAREIAQLDQRRGASAMTARPQRRSALSAAL